MWGKRLAVGPALAGLVAIGVTAKPAPAEAWWRGGWCCGVGIGIVLPPVVVAPPPAYYPPPAYCAAAPGILSAAPASLGITALARQRVGAWPLGLIRLWQRPEPRTRRLRARSSQYPTQAVER